VVQAGSGRFIERIEDLLPWAEEWDRLCLRQPRPNPMQSWDWVTAWWQVYGAGDPAMSLRVWVVSEGDRLLTVLPLYRKETKRGARHHLLGSGESQWEEVCSDYLGPLVDPDADPSVLERTGRVLSGLLGSPRDSLLLLHIAEGHPAIAAWAAGLRSTGKKVRFFYGPPCPYFPLAESFDGQLNQFSANFRSQFRRSVRAWQDAGGAEVEWHDQKGTLEAFWEHLVALHQARWTSRGRPGVFSSPRFNAFHREVLARFHRRGWLMAGALKSGGRTVAANYSFRMGDTVFHYQSGVETPWSAKWSPGILLHGEVVKRAIAEGAKEYDFLRGPDEYKRRFTSLSRDLVSIEAARSSLRQDTSWQWDTLKGWLRPAYRRLFAR